MWIFRGQLSDSLLAPQPLKNFCCPEAATRGHPLLANWRCPICPNRRQKADPEMLG